MPLVITVIIIFVLLVASELWWRKRKPHDEFSRKFIHIFVGSMVAFAPFYLSWAQIILLSIGFIGAVSVSKYFNIFKSIHAVERPTWGEIFFALAVGVLAIITREPWIYAAALLHMSLADGLAAIVGVSWGKGSQYKVFGHTKSLVGSATFFIVSVTILLTYSTVTDHGLTAGVIIALAAVATAVENAGVAGLDNLLVPVLIGVALETLA